MPARSIARLAAPLCAALAALSPLAAQELRLLAPLAGDHYTSGIAISGDGRVTTGSSCVAFFDTCKAALWSRSGQPENLGVPSGASDALPTAINDDGSAIAGFAFLPTGGIAFRWTRAQGFQDLGLLPGSPFGAEAYGISGDGTVVAGHSGSASGDWHAFRWTETGGMRDLGTLPGGTYSFAFALSRDGSTVVGFGNTSSMELGYRWTARGGMQPLRALAPEESTGAFAVSSNGREVTGYSGSRAVLWRGNSVHDLGFLPGGTFAVGYAISGDGRIIGGMADDASGALKAVLWTPALGMVDLYALLAILGVDLQGWSFTVVAGISEDGSSMTGIGTYQGEERGWSLQLPVRGNSAPGWLARTLRGRR
ncbi:MAG: hypothetical protein JNM84_04400 [Planctomycetes bacterium]|nr:hypothetical protein [Planctomycetota bacterium]